jgi:hypothetical protein
MTRRAIKKMLRRSEEAIREDRPGDAECIYRTLLEAFQTEPPSLLDHAAAIYGLVKSLHAQDETERAIAVAQSACSILAERQPVEVAA